MNNFNYYTPTKVYFGKGEEERVGELIKEYGATKVLIVYGGGSAERSGLLPKVRKKLAEADIKFCELGGVKANPELPLVREGIELCKKENVDFVLAVGGGSVLDTAKDVANGYANPDVDVWQFTLKKASPKKTLKKGVILTIAAAGSEMSDSCVITDPETNFKGGYGSPLNRMDFAIMNPELTFTVSPYQTACGVVDIAMHTMERYFSPGEETYLTDGIAEAVMKAAFHSGLALMEHPDDYNARANIMWASSLAHNGLTACGRNVKTLVVHQFEHGMSALYPSIAHGAGLASLWCSWARYVCDAAQDRFLKFACNVWNLDVNFDRPELSVYQVIDTQENYYKTIGMPTRMRDLGIKEEDIEKLAEMCSQGRTRVLPGYKELAYEDILNIYKMAY